MWKIDLNRLKDSMANDLDLLITVLENYGFKDPRQVNGGIRCGWDSNSKGDSIIISLCEYQILSYKRFSNGESGDILNLLSDKKGCSFKDLISELYKIFEEGYSTSNFKSRDLDILDKFLEIEEEEVDEYIVLDENILEKPEISIMLVRDGIPPSVQMKFRLWYDDYYNRICFNWRDLNGHLVGVNGRLNAEIVPDEVPKYFPTVINFKKGQHLFGLYENKIQIKEAKKAVLFESEKSVLQCDVFDFHLAVAVGSSSATVKQLKILNFLGVEELIFAFDEGIDIKESMVRISEMCAQNSLSFKLKFIEDKNNIFIKKGSKCSPSDLGKDIFYKLLDGHIFGF